MRGPETVSKDELYQVLCNSVGSDPRFIKSATERLAAMVKMAGTFDGLSLIASERSAPLLVRQQAILQFKNHALPSWRNRVLLSPEDRANIRDRCLSLLDEGDETIAKINAIIISKLARTDFPANWPNLIPTLLAAVNEQMQIRLSVGALDARGYLILLRSLEILNKVSKEFASIKMPLGIQTMAQMTEQLCLVCQSHYAALVATFPSDIRDSVGLQNAMKDLKAAHVLYKSLSKMFKWLWGRFKQSAFEHLRPQLVQFFQNSASQYRVLFNARLSFVRALAQGPSGESQTKFIELLTKHILCFGKFFRALQKQSVESFINLPNCSDLVLSCWASVVEATNELIDAIQDSPTALYPVRMLVQCMVMFRESLAQWSPKDGTKINTLSKEFVEDAVRILITRFMPLNPKDLHAWSMDPEDWFNHEEDNDHWEYEIRACSERVLMTLTKQYDAYVIPLVQMTFNQIAGQRFDTVEDIVRKEALYCAIGRCAFRLKEAIPFEAWLANTLVAEARDQSPLFPILKRRIAWVIGRWISEECSSPNNPLIWEILLHLLKDRGPGSDGVVRLSAVVALRECLDTLDFKPDVFTPHIGTAVSELVKLIGEMDTVEAKRRITQTLNVLVDRVEQRIVPHVQSILEMIPEFWTSAEKDYALKASLLTTVTVIIQSTKENSTALAGIVVPLVRECFGSAEASLVLDEDALALWQAALRNSVTLESINGGASLFDLMPIAITLLAENLDLMGKTVCIVESYILLDASKVLSVYGLSLLSAATQANSLAPSTVNRKGLLMVLNLLFQCAPSQLWAEPLHTSGLFWQMLKVLSDDKADVTVLTEHIYIFARMCLVDAPVFVQLVAATAQAQGMAEKDLWRDVLDHWWRRFDNMSEPRGRKLAAMGIANLVATGRADVLQRLTSEIFNLWLDVFGEIKEAQSSADEKSEPSSFIKYWQAAGDAAINNWLSEAESTTEYERRQRVYQNDPVTSTMLTSFVALRLNQAQQVCAGPQSFQATYLHDADPTVLKQIQDELAS